ncbi:hypothetical protein N7454_008058 [Penicillium verhagenii]|nr:hypothetical protein N7454_008058 [Penicillium verhagenii]
MEPNPPWPRFFREADQKSPNGHDSTKADPGGLIGPRYMVFWATLAQNEIDAINHPMMIGRGFSTKPSRQAFMAMTPLQRARLTLIVT